MKFKKIMIIPTKKNIETQYTYLVKQSGYTKPLTRLSIFYDTLRNLNDNYYKDKLTLKQLEILKNKKMIKVNIVEVII